MQKPNWNDLRYLLAVGRTGTIAGAARLVGVDNTTVSRRLAALQEAAGQVLFRRTGESRLDLTEAGQLYADIAERTESDLDELAPEGADRRDPVSGVVRLTSVPLVVNRILAPAVGGLLSRHPGLRLELIADPRDFSLTRREADLAIRFSRPKVGGIRVKSRRIGTLRFDLYAGADHDTDSLPWVLYEERMGHLPQAQWLTARAKSNQRRHVGLAVNDMETAIEAVAAGYGKTLFPRLIAESDERLQRVEADGVNVDRELWLLFHADLASLPRTRAVASWIETALQGGLPPSEPGVISQPPGCVRS